MKGNAYILPSGQFPVKIERSLKVAVLAYALLSALKIGGGILSGSFGLIADGIDNTYNVLTSFLALRFYSISLKPADREHPLGHSKFDTFGAVVISAIMMATGASLITASSLRLHTPVQPVGLPFALASTLFTGFILTFYAINLRLSRSSSVSAEVRHTLSDFIQSAMVLGGVVLSLEVSSYFNAASAAVVGGLLLYQGVKGIVGVKDAIVDREVEEVREKVMEIAREVQDINFREIHTTSSGRDKVRIEIYLQVDSGMSVGKAHEVAHEVERMIRQRLKGIVEHCVIHVEPYGSHREGD